MVLKASQERVKALLKDTITLLCKNGLEFKDNFSVEALIGVTLDNDEVVLISMNEVVRSEGAQGAFDTDFSKDVTVPDTTSVRSKRHGERLSKRKRSTSPSTDQPRVKMEPGSPANDEENFGSFNPKAEDLWGGGNPPSLSPSTLEESNLLADKTSVAKQNSERLGDQNSTWDCGEQQQSEHASPEQFEQDEEEADELHDDGEDIVFIKEEASEHSQSSQEQSQRFQRQFSSQSYSQSPDMSMMSMSTQDNSMAWSQSPRGNFHGTSFSPRMQRTSTITSGSSELQQQQPGTEHQNMQGAQQQQATWTSENGQFTCSICDKVFTNLHSIKTHVNLHKQKYRYYCPYCPKGFMSTSMLSGHISWHTGICEYKCHLCGRDYRYKRSLKDHLSTGTCQSSMSSQKQRMQKE